MGFQSRWQDLPRDARWGYLAAMGYALWLAMTVLLGPDMMFVLPWCIIYPLIGVAILALLVGLAMSDIRHNLMRLAPLALLFGCLLTPCVLPGVGIDLHLVYRVYRAGGPKYLNTWAQPLIKQQQAKPSHSTSIESSQLPTRIRRHLPGHASIGGTLWSDLARVRIELGGGFFHYGVVIYPSANAPPAEWWQELLDWPPEVVIYQE